MVLRIGTVKRVALVAGLTLAVAGMARPAFAADDGYQNVFSSVLSAVGVLPADQSPEIDYRERAPLVLPPKQTLVKPEEPGAKRTAAWPVDPDVVRRKKEAEDLHSPIFGFEKNKDRGIGREEAMKYRAVEPMHDIGPSGCRTNEHSEAGCRLSPDEMKAEEARFKAANPEKTEVAVGQEPQREYLTQPPKGYMKQTKAVDVTHEAPVQKKNDDNPLSTMVHTNTRNVDPLNN